jgi:hypothetical protein
MLARFVVGAVTAGAVIAPAMAGMMNADEARKFVAGKVFAFTCGRRSAIQRLRSRSSPSAAWKHPSGPRPSRVRLDQGHSF